VGRLLISMENGEWRVESKELKMGNGEYRKWDFGYFGKELV